MLKTRKTQIFPIKNEAVIFIHTFANKKLWKVKRISIVCKRLKISSNNCNLQKLNRL